MSKKRTKLASKSFTEIFNQACFELLHPQSDSPLIDYDQIKNLLNWKSLKLVDGKQLKLLNFALLAGFFQYIGALTLFLGLVISSSYIILTQVAINSGTSVSYEFTKSLAQMIEPYSSSVGQSDSSTIAYSRIENDKLEVHPKPLIIFEQQVETQTFKPQCSFQIGNARYSSNASFNKSNIKSKGLKVCATVQNSTDSSCETFSNLTNMDQIQIDVTDSSSGMVGTCSLTIVDNQLAKI